MGSGLRALAAAGATALIASLVATTPPSATAGASTALEARARPNVVVVLTDDMRADELRFLPAVRRLQRTGVTFSRALSADSLCCPARATLLTGKLAHNHRTIGNNLATHGGFRVFAENNDVHDLLPQWLHEQQYRTAWIGKYLNDMGGAQDFTQPGWSYFAAAVTGVYDYHSSGFSINGHYRTDGRYRELFTRALLMRRVRHWAPAQRPFFVVYNSLAPHKGRAPGGGWGSPRTQRIHRDFDPGRLDVRPSVGEADLSDKPLWLQSYAATLARPKTYPWRFETRRVEALMSVNDTVRDLIQTLREEHELGRTVVVFTSDNGFLLHEHDLTDKNKAYEESVHVPLVVRGPGFRGGGAVADTVSLADLTATILRIAGVTATHGGDGVPLQAVRADPISFESRPVEIEGSVAQYPGRDTLPTDPIGRFYKGAVWGPYSLVRYETGDWEFYDRTQDPWQLQNSYVEHPEHGSPEELLQNWYLDHVNCEGSPCNDRTLAP